jgi:hypothetical protein
MPLITCSECNKEISDKAWRCPQCGAPAAKAAAKMPVVLGIAILAIGIGVAAFLLAARAPMVRHEAREVERQEARDVQRPADEPGRREPERFR